MYPYLRAKEFPFIAYVLLNFIFLWHFHEMWFGCHSNGKKHLLVQSFHFGQTGGKKKNVILMFNFISLYR